MNSSELVTFADLANQRLSFSRKNPIEKAILELIDTPWLQRLRHIQQTANTSLVYMFSEHSRFGHTLGVTYSVRTILNQLRSYYPDKVAELEAPISIAALIHDIGHLAPGSHAAFQCWFPNSADIHEKLAVKIFRSSPDFAQILEKFPNDCLSLVEKIILEDAVLPAWSWQILSGPGWNADRGNWCIIDSILAGVDYGKYNFPAIVDSIIITKDNELAFFENRLDAMVHFAVSRQAMYRQVYHHRVLLGVDKLTQALVKRARATRLKLPFLDETMATVLNAKEPDELTSDTIFNMVEPWWGYHLRRWQEAEDKILADLASRLVNRNLFKTVRVADSDDLQKMEALARKELEKLGLDPSYYLFIIESKETFKKDQQHSPKVLREDGDIVSLWDIDPIFKMLERADKARWLVIPAEVKIKLGRSR
jgi:uncharacterized protein